MAREREPRIDRFVDPIITPGTDEFIEEREPSTFGPPGTLLLFVGRGFGNDPSKIVTSFGAEAVVVMPSPLFSETQVLVSVPTVAAGALSVSITAAGVESNKVSFRVEPQSSLAPPGDRYEALLKLLSR